MNEKTGKDYQRLAEHFYRTRLPGKPPSPKRICDALAACADEYRPDYWRKLRNALEHDQRAKGFSEAADRIAGVKNPTTAADSTKRPPGKQQRVTRVVEADEQALLRKLRDREDLPSMYAILVASLTGARPAEMPNIRVEGSLVHIEGAKKSHEGLRGLDRTIQLDPGSAQVVADAMQFLRGAAMKPIQDRIDKAARAVWPRRKHRLSLYSWRHQLGSNLKASGMDPRQVAYLMGHQSTRSVDQYGDKRTPRAAALPVVPAGADLSQIRDKPASRSPRPPEEVYDFGFDR